ncbi:opioid-binding protein/cell adhesion molecule homolog [Haliotis cracherodii]|uniref:opioid-binding protein/cell adhesion molecule homolog n=1 Tax=Haliotis cracherodii TaxID=6455 RepID=UPI0039E74C56
MMGPERSDLGLVSVPTTSDHVVTYVGHNAVISLNVSQAGGEFKVGVEVDNVTEYLFVKFNDTGITRLNNSRTWHRDRYRVRGNITSSVFRLTLYNVTTEDAGIYECRKTDINQRPPGCEQLIIVAQKPSQPNITGPASAVSGGSVTLTCSSSSRSLAPDHPPLTMTYTWRRNSEKIQGGGDASLDGSSLTLRHISSEKDGNYTCRAVEEGLESDWSHGHVLDVQYGPYTVQFNEHDDKVTATEGDPLTVTCCADCNPTCTVTWWDTSRQRGTSGQREAVLSIPAVNRSLSDLYKCHVNNTYGNKSRNLKLDIQSAESGVSNVVSTAVICSVLVVVVAVVLAILLYRHKAKKVWLHIGMTWNQTGAMRIYKLHLQRITVPGTALCERTVPHLSILQLPLQRITVPGATLCERTVPHLSTLQLSLQRITIAGAASCEGTVPHLHISPPFSCLYRGPQYQVQPYVREQFNISPPFSYLYRGSQYQVQPYVREQFQISEPVSCLYRGSQYQMQPYVREQFHISPPVSCL